MKGAAAQPSPKPPLFLSGLFFSPSSPRVGRAPAQFPLKPRASLFSLFSLGPVRAQPIPLCFPRPSASLPFYLCQAGPTGQTLLPPIAQFPLPCSLPAGRALAPWARPSASHPRRTPARDRAPSFPEASPPSQCRAGWFRLIRFPRAQRSPSRFLRQLGHACQRLPVALK
jgi:hypothetical protein